jgi:hypothetical protein
MQVTFSILTLTVLVQAGALRIHLRGTREFMEQTNEIEFLMNITCEYKHAITSLRDLDDLIFNEWDMTRETSHSS